MTGSTRVQPLRNVADYAAATASRAMALLTTAGLVAFLFLVVGLGPLNPASAQAAEDGRTWVVARASGDVEIRSTGFFSGSWKPLKTGQVIEGAAEIRTGKHSRVVLRHRTTTMTANSNSRLQLPDGANLGGAYRVLQNLGSILYKIKKRATSMAAFEVETRYLVAVVKGTVFTVNATAKEATVDLDEGVVAVRSTRGGSGATLRPGQKAYVGGTANSGVKVSGRGAVKASGSRGPNRPAKASANSAAKSAGGKAKAGEAGAASGGGYGSAETDSATVGSTNSTNSTDSTGAAIGTRVAALTGTHSGAAGGGSGGSGGAKGDDGDRKSAGAGGSTGGTDGGPAGGGGSDNGPGGDGGGKGDAKGDNDAAGSNGDDKAARMAQDPGKDLKAGAKVDHPKAVRRSAETANPVTKAWTASGETLEKATAELWGSVTSGATTLVGALCLLAIWAVAWIIISVLWTNAPKEDKQESGRRRQPSFGSA